MADAWVMEEMKNIDLKDERLNGRLREVLSQLSRRPTAGIPEACGGRAETTGAYRLFDNEKATFGEILNPHAEATRQRMAAQSTVLLVQDTTEIDLTRPNQQVKKDGPLDGSKRCGMFLHTLHAITPDGTPLGTLDAKAWTRDRAKPTNSKRTRAERAAVPIEEKESFRWLQMQRALQRETETCPDTQVIGLGDSEADIYEVLAEGSDIDWIIRSSQDRALQLQPSAGVPSGKSDRLHDQLLRQPILYSETLKIRGRKPKISCETRGRRQPRKSRKARVAVRSARVALRPPWRPDRGSPQASCRR